MDKIKPDLLKKEDKAIIISPSGSVDHAYIHGAKHVLESWGLRVEVAPNAYGKNGRYSGTISERLSDLQNAINDPQAKLILCSRGGYGAVHLLDKLNFDGIKKHPKWVVGYSDITALHLALLKNGIQSVHAPMAKHLTEDCEDMASISLKELLLYKNPHYEIKGHRLNIEGKTEGILFGGNLSVFCSLMGSAYTEVPENGILFLEDIGEYPYRIDRMIWNLKIAGIFDKIKGLIIGSFSEVQNDNQMKPVYEAIADVVGEYNIPVAFDFPVGHVKENYALIHGGKVHLSVTKEKSSFYNI
ncbi:LD-carboxypeptidase [Dysgonomonas sp. 216]|uniref:S66 peptidase family protein n=1 Tax=Dysgonomonas sp. 216 TaxID=2302934 RepID=UPI0013D27CAE|nr:LD-carboxypeptidase [Dysgonomonas sp. 216]NDW19739.1 LD-carboxypeptidase [Dysgonomonas sp. 216]